MLPEQFPGLFHTLGEESFCALLEAYRESAPALPSGEGLALFIEALPSPVPFLADLARLDWALSQAPFKVESRPSTPAPHRQSVLRLNLPCLQKLELAWPAHRIYAGEEISEPEAITYLLHRTGEEIHLLPLSAFERSALELVEAGQSVQNVHFQLGEGGGRIVEEWIAEGLLV